MRMMFAGQVAGRKHCTHISIMISADFSQVAKLRKWKEAVRNIERLRPIDLKTGLYMAPDSRVAPCLQRLEDK